MNRLVILGVAIVALIYVVFSSLYVVNEREQAILTRFGNIQDVKTEPGIYFNPWLSAQWRAQGLHTDLIDYDALERHMDFGGVRIEDDVLVTTDGARVLGPPIARTADEVEAACAGAA